MFLHRRRGRGGMDPFLELLIAVPFALLIAGIIIAVARYLGTH